MYAEYLSVRRPFWSLYGNFFASFLDSIQITDPRMRGSISRPFHSKLQTNLTVMGIGQRIRQARMESMKSVAHLAKLCETDLATVNGWENESIEFPREFAYRIAQDLNVSIGWLEKDEGPAEQPPKPAEQNETSGGILSPSPTVTRLNAATVHPTARIQAPDLSARKAKPVKPENVSAGNSEALRETLLESLASSAAIVAADPGSAHARKMLKDLLQAVESYEALATALSSINGGRR